MYNEIGFQFITLPSLFSFELVILQPHNLFIIIKLL